MAVRIKISYTNNEELEQIRKLLSPFLKHYKLAKNKEGQYKKAYMWN